MLSVLLPLIDAPFAKSIISKDGLSFSVTLPLYFLIRPKLSLESSIHTSNPLALVALNFSNVYDKQS